MAWTPEIVVWFGAAIPAEGGGSSFANTLAAALIAVAVFLIVSSLLRRRINAGRSGANETAAPSERIEELREAAAARDTLGTVMAQSEELARRLASMLDAKAMVLERQILDADERIARLEELEQRGVGSAAARGTETRPALALEGERDPLKKRIYELADRGMSATDIARETEQPTGQVELILALRSA